MVRPGLTGYAQVHGRNFLNWEERFQLDVYYAGHITFCGDIKILIDTVRVMIFRDNIAVNAVEDLDECRRKQEATSNTDL